MYIDRKHIHNKRKTVADQTDFQAYNIVVYFFSCNQEIFHKCIVEPLLFFPATYSSYSFPDFPFPLPRSLHAKVKHKVTRERGKKGGREEERIENMEIRIGSLTVQEIRN